MKPSAVFFTWVIGLALSSAVSADIYESEDVEGNPVFTDSPSAGAEVVNNRSGRASRAARLNGRACFSAR